MDRQLAEEIEMLHAQVCFALGDPKRLMLLYVLAGEPHNVSELAAELDIPQPTLSRHLTILRERSLVKAKRHGNSIYYSLVDQRVIEALDLLRALLRDRILNQAQLADFSALDAHRSQSEEK